MSEKYNTLKSASDALHAQNQYVLSELHNLKLAVEVPAQQRSGF